MTASSSSPNGRGTARTIVGDPAIGVTEGPFNTKQQQKGRTTRKARWLGESYADEGAADRSGVARGPGGLLGPLRARERRVDGRVLLGLVGPALGLHDHPDQADEERGHDDRGNERGDVVHASRVARRTGTTRAGCGLSARGQVLWRVRRGRGRVSGDGRAAGGGRGEKSGGGGS